MNATQRPRHRACGGDGPHGRPRPPEEEGGKTPPRVIVAEDDRDMRGLVAWSLRKRGHEVLECASEAALLDLFETPTEDHPRFDLIIWEVRMPNITGPEASTKIRSKEPSTPVIVMTAFPEVETRVAASELGAAACFRKPFETSDLCRLADWIPSWRSMWYGRPSPNTPRPAAGQNEK